LDASCRYLTIGKDVLQDEIIDFHANVNPSGVLSLMLGKGVFHCIDNDVEYMNLEGDK
jgi:hypothetical protein